MKTFIAALLVLHIVAGFTALITGFVATVTAKGGRRHRQSGRIYFWAMTLVFITATVIGVARGKVFLFLTGFFSYYLVVRGYRILSLKKLGAGQSATWLDWSIAAIAMIFGASLVGWSIFGEARSFAAVPFVFGSICLVFSARDIVLFVKGPKERNHWLFSHIISMGAGYIATWTAFVVTNVHFLPPVVVWLAPSAAGTVCILFATRKYCPKPAAPLPHGAAS
jgi:uncharacterized membrane protein